MGDIIVYQRNMIDRDVFRSMDYWRALGRIVLVDIDDHYPGLPPSNPAHNYWIKNVHNINPIPIEMMRIGLSKSDGLVAPSKILLKDWEHVVHGYYWPNYPTINDYEGLDQKPIGHSDYILSYKEPVADEDNLVVRERENSEGQIVIGWGGSISHVDSFIYSGVLGALKRIMEENENVVFKFCGSEQRLDFLLKELPVKQMVKQASVRPDDWPLVISTFDIGIAPLDMRPCESKTGHEHGVYSYDERRSWLKAVEYLCAGVPWVATKSETYKDMEPHGKCIENGEENWYNALKARVDSLDYFKREAWKKRTWALNRLTIENNVGRLIEFYRKVIVDASLRRGARLPDVHYL